MKRGNLEITALSLTYFLTVERLEGVNQEPHWYFEGAFISYEKAAAAAEPLLAAGLNRQIEQVYE